MKTWLPLLAVSLPLFLADQISKFLVMISLPPGGSVEVVPGVFNLVHVFNTGAAFGMGKNQNEFFMALSVLALAGMLFVWGKGKIRNGWTRFAVALLVGGVAGNLADRIFRGHVLDFLDVVLPWYGHWPAFNIADTCICIAAGLLILRSFSSTGGHESGRAGS